MRRKIAPPPGYPKRQPCIGPCRKQFWSEGPWNHVCPKCNTANEANPLPGNRVGAGCPVHTSGPRDDPNAALPQPEEG